MEDPKVTPQDPLVAYLVKLLDEGKREDFEERAGIMEFDANLPRDHAECLALLDVLHRHPAVLTGVIVLRVEVDGAAQYWLTTDPAYARAQLAEIGGVEKGNCDPAALISESFAGIAMLTAIR